MKAENSTAQPRFKPFKKVLPGLIFLASIFLLNFISRVIFAPLLPVIEADLGISHTASGSFFLLISMGYCFGILGSGFVSSRLSHKGTIVASTIGCGLVLCVLSMCSTLSAIRVTVFCLGLSSGMYLPSGLATITRIVAPAYWARGVAIHELAPNMGFVLVPFLCALLLELISWSQSLLLLGIILIIAGTFYWTRRVADAGYGVRPDFAVYLDIVKRGEFWLMVVLFSLAICSTLGLYTMLPLYLVTDRHMQPDAANHLVSVSRISSVVMPIVAGWVGDRFGNKRVTAVVLFVTGLLTIPIGLCSDHLLIVFVVLQPMVAVCFFPSGFAIISAIGKTGGSNVAVTLCIPLAFLIGGGVIPIMIGVIGDHASLGTGFVAAGCAILSGGIVALYFLQKNFRAVTSESGVERRR